MVEVLFLCTGNLCRSPSAAWFLRQRLAERGPVNVTVSSAGTTGASGGPPAALLREGNAIGMDLGDHTSHRLTVVDVVRADLVIGMAREHVREAVLMDRSSFDKVYTFRDIVRRGSAVGARQADEALPEWLVRVHGGRRHLDLIGDGGPDDIPDPMGESSEQYRNMLTELDSLTASLHTLLWG
jgi:protein-tyrosine phosphatase